MTEEYFNILRKSLFSPTKENFIQKIDHNTIILSNNVSIWTIYDFRISKKREPINIVVVEILSDSHTSQTVFHSFKDLFRQISKYDEDKLVKTYLYLHGITEINS